MTRLDGCRRVSRILSHPLVNALLPESDAACSFSVWLTLVRLTRSSGENDSRSSITPASRANSNTKAAILGEFPILLS